MKKSTAIIMNAAISVIGFTTGIYLMFGGAILCLGLILLSKSK